MCLLHLARAPRERLQRSSRFGNWYSFVEFCGFWSVKLLTGLVDLRFEADGERDDSVNFGLVVSKFYQPYGHFTGRLKDREGRSFEVDGLYGVTEQHYARW